VNATDRLEFRTLTTLEELDSLRGEWDDLVRAMRRPSPWLLHAWLVEWWGHHADSGRLAVHVACRDGRLVGALPLCVRRRRGIRVAEFVGGKHSKLADVLVGPGEGDEVAPALADRAEASGHDYADLLGLPGGSRLAAALGTRLEIIERAESPVLDLTPGWEAVYAAKLSSKRRSSLRRNRRALAELGKLDVELARTWEDIEPALEDVFRLHALRWDGRPDGTELQTEAGREFYRAAYRRFTELDIARIITLKLDGRAIAFSTYIAFCDALYSDRIGFDPEFRRYSPGFLNTLDMLEAAAAEGLTRVEFLGGREEYKVVFADEFAPLHEAFGLVRTPQGRVAVTAELSVVKLRRRLRSSPLRRIYFEKLAPVRRAIGSVRRAAAEP
jgi:CelD/BcsL family acetyltransferase involved in cellulose biosynthesis